MAELAYNGLAKQIKTIYGPTDFESVDQLVSKVSAYERAHPEFLRNKQKKLVNFVLPRTKEQRRIKMHSWCNGPKQASRYTANGLGNLMQPQAMTLMWPRQSRSLTC